MRKTQENSEIYKCYLNFGKITENTKIYKKVEFETKGQKCTVYAIKKPVKKSMIIYLEEDGTIYREHLLPFGHILLPSRVKTSILKLSPAKDETVIVLFSGKPNFMGLDNGMFASPKNKNKSPSSIYVMTETSFKLFNL